MERALSKKKTELFESMAISKAVLQLSVPTVFGCLVMILYNLADTYFVGKLDDPVQTTAVTLVAPVILLFNAVNNLFGVGTGSLMSRAFGIKDYETVRKASAFGFYAALICGIAFSLIAIVFQNPILALLGSKAEDHAATLEYMKWTVFCGATPAILNVVLGNMVRSEGAAMHATIGTVSGCLLNIVLDPIFILKDGLNMGAAGAGLATFLSNTVACLYFFVYIFVKKEKTFVSVRIREAVPKKAIVKDVFSVGVPSAIQNALNVTGMTILNNCMADYGTEAVSAIGIAHKMSMIPMYVSMGIGQGIMPLIGYNYSAGNKKRIREALAFVIKISAALVLALAAVFMIFSGNIISSFMENELVVSYGTAFFRGMTFATPFFALDFLAVGIFQACGLGIYALFFAVARKLLLEIPAIFLLDYLFPMYGVAYSQLCAEVVLAIAAVFMLRRIVRDTPQKQNLGE